MSQFIVELPSPEGNTLVGNLIDLGHDPLGFLTQCARDYGGIVPLRLGLTQACLISNPDYIEEVLKNQDTFIKSRGFRALRSLLGEGLLTSEGETWFRQRRLVQPVFHQKRIAGYGEVMVAYAEGLLDSWQDGETRDVHDDMMRLTLNIVMKTIFNQDVTEGDAKNVAQALDVAMDWFESKRKQNFLFLEWFPRPENIRYRNAIQKMDETIYSLINQRRNSTEEVGDLLSMLMQARDEEDNSQMSDKQLRDEVATLMLAGHETTANALSWTWMLLSQHPEVQAKLQDELQAVLGGRSPTIADLPHLQYTSRVIKESMRLYPPVALLGREAVKDCEIGGYGVPEGCLILISQWVMHRDSHYFEEAEVFKPERWANDLEKQLPRGVYIPFGDGPRICIGKGFALMEATLLLATIAQTYQLELVPNHPIELQPSITLRPEQGIKVVLKKR
ncbi:MULTISPECIES: cytochrome P450 [unclassified Coleofasciculus]|uniref:cytochrome P450 n=1 Tax=unclassified Coleofasciculus TaxID=2692782 RepID=UPI001881ADA1|nr:MULTISPECIES: cytochrome P450 [unclassified Coleofasciculus]MBE9127602.1 cytochrome P450 [Coleofasciculus sp. LEGE 07081]MBE9150927.1 cytochrome P450 [Coleofasciculus sp. LEGE 07092]